MFPASLGQNIITQTLYQTFACGASLQAVYHDQDVCKNIKKGSNHDYSLYLLCLLAMRGARFPRLDLAHEQELYPQDGRDNNQGPCHLSRGGAQIGRGGGKTGRDAREGAPCLTLAHSCLCSHW